MKAIKLLLILLIVGLLASCATSKPNGRANGFQPGHNNIYIGKDVGRYSIKGSYNIVITDSADWELQHITDSYLFIVDYDCEFFKDNPKIERRLKAISLRAIKYIKKRIEKINN